MQKRRVVATTRDEVDKLAASWGCGDVGKSSASETRLVREAKEMKADAVPDKSGIPCHLAVTIRDDLYLLMGPETQVYLALACFANRGGECHPGMRAIEKCTGLTRVTVRRAIGGLQRKGWLAVQTRFWAGKGHQSNEYRLLKHVVRSPETD